MRFSNINNISIKWKLIIPFLLLAFVGTSSLIYLSLHFLERTFLIQEKRQLLCTRLSFLGKIGESATLALTLAKEAAANPVLKEAVATGNRTTIQNLCTHSHQILQGCFKPLGWSFYLFNRNGVRLYPPGNTKTLKISSPFVRSLLNNQRAVSDIAMLNDHLIIYGASPVYYQKRYAGLTLGTTLVNKDFLQTFTRVFAIQCSLFSYDQKQNTLKLLTSTLPPVSTLNKAPSLLKTSPQAPSFYIKETRNASNAILVTFLKNNHGKPVALLQIVANRKPSLMILKEFQKDMILVGVAGLLLSVGIIFWITIIFTKPIAKLVQAAEEIAVGRPIQEIHLPHMDEIGILGNALNNMLRSLEESHRKIQDYAENLEKKVRERTRALTESEEKYRTLVERVPLVVYRTDEKGGLTFVNTFVETLLGYDPEDALKNPDFFLQRMVEEDRENYNKLWENCLLEGKAFETEYRLLDKNNQVVYVLDHAIPLVSEDGKVKRIDGIIVDITDRKRAEERFLQAEELRTLREISSRLAHEIRNPLTIAGGFTRQLLRSLDTKDPNRKKLEIIASEVEKLEKILKTTLEYIKPTTLNLRDCNLTLLLKPLIESYKSKFSKQRLRFQADLDPALPSVKLDAELFYQVIKSMLDLIIACIPKNAQCDFRTYSENKNAVVSISLKGVCFLPEKLDSLVSPFPFSTETDLPLSLPLAKIIIQKHNGLLQIRELEKDHHLITITIPYSS